MSASERLVNLLLIGAAFLIALLVYNTDLQGGLGPYGMTVGSGASVVAFWLSLEFLRANGRSTESWWVGFVEQFCLGTGVNLLLHALLTYTLFTRRTPILITFGGLLASAFLTAYGHWNLARDGSKKRFLLVGFDPVMHKVLKVLRQPVIGVIGGDPAAGGTVPYLGGFATLEQTVTEQRPTNIVIDMKEWSRRIRPATLLNYRLSGIEIDGSLALYERLYSRICCERLRPGDLLLSAALRGNSRTIAVQSVYTNLIALALLLLLAPVIALASLMVALFSGPGPVFESVECAGFQYIPFRLLRFRTTKYDGTSSLTLAGRWIAKMRLTNVPQLFNVVRGDMALVGPRPARLAFARYLTETMPFYSHRFSVKPGMMGWAQSHVPAPGLCADECLQIEYDLYYVKEGSLWMDIEIMLGTLLSAGRPGTTATPVPEPRSAGL